MNSIQISLTAKNYANALCKLAIDNIVSYDEILKNLETIKEICLNSRDLTTVLNNPSISNDIKYSIIEDCLKQDINLKIIDFIKVLVEKNRFNEFDGIVEAYKEKLNEVKNIQQVTVISAIELNENLKKQIVEKLTKKLNKTISAIWNIDENIIGGLVVKINDDIIDTSLKNKLENLSKNII